MPSADDPRQISNAATPADNDPAPDPGITVTDSMRAPRPAREDQPAGAPGEGTAASSSSPATEGEPAPGEDDPAQDSRRATTVEHPAKVMRIGTMIKQLLDEVKASPLDEAARERLAAIHTQSIKELEEGLSPELVEELERLSLPFSADQTPSDAELRIAQAQLVGWLEGLFHGLQTALVAQQMAAQAQLSGMRRELPPGVSVERLPPGLVLQRRADDDSGKEHGTGQYL